MIQQSTKPPIKSKHVDCTFNEKYELATNLKQVQQIWKWGINVQLNKKSKNSRGLHPKANIWTKLRIYPHSEKL